MNGRDTGFRCGRCRHGLDSGWSGCLREHLGLVDAVAVRALHPLLHRGPVGPVDALGVVGERELRARLLEADAELLVLERAELARRSRRPRGTACAGRTRCRCTSCNRGPALARREGLGLVGEDARVEALVERHVRELRIGAESAEHHRTIVFVLREVTLEERRLHLHVVVDDDDDTCRARDSTPRCRATAAPEFSWRSMRSE